MTIEVRTENALDRLVRKTRELFDAEPELDKRWAALSPILAELLADPDVIEASRNWPECVFADGRAENLLFYEDLDFKFAINGLVSGARAGGNPLIHDHAHIYTLYGLMDGHQRIERFERLDDRSRPDYAEIRATRSTVCGPGEIDLVPPYEIHREIGIGERTVAVIIRSEKSGGFNQGRYVPDTNGYYESLGPRQTPCEMLPPSSAD
jgi:predicted metal-dependent enzyme (double-stranded beta helix superfamily)